MEGNSSVEKWKPRLESKGLKGRSDLRSGLIHSLILQMGKLGPSEWKDDPVNNMKTLCWRGAVLDEHMFKKSRLLACKLQVHM